MPYRVEIPVADDAELRRALEWATDHDARATELVEAPRRLLALFERTPELSGGLEGLTASVHDEQLLDDDSTWSASLRPQAYGPLWVVPAGHAVPAGAEHVVKLGGASEAFGSGLHPTTQLCLERVVAHAPVESMLDVGAGTGILALAALALGAEKATALEVDPRARAWAATNAQDSGLKLDVRDGEALREIDERYDLVVANILGPELMALAPAITRTMGRGATLVLAGIRPDLAAEVSLRYVRLGLAHLLTEERGGWVMQEYVARW